MTSGLPRSTRETVACDTPARWAMSIEVALVFFFARAGSCIAAVCIADVRDFNAEKKKADGFPSAFFLHLARPEG